MKTVLNVAGIALVIAEYCMLMADKPLIAGLAGLMAVASLIPIWLDERVVLVSNARRRLMSFGIGFRTEGIFASPSATIRSSHASRRRPSLQPVRSARAA